MIGLITDRTQQNVARRGELSRKGWANMTTAERTEWTGNPFETDGANLLPNGPFYSSAVGLEYRLGEIVATATASGTYLYAISMIGDAALFENKTFTLSVDAIEAAEDSVPQLALYWHDANGFEYAGASIFEAGSVTVDTSLWPNTAGRESLALYVYVTTTIAVPIGAEVRFSGVMLERGSVRHPYMPYAEIAATPATKGAYNYSDLNRVERAVAEISARAGLNLVTRTNWGMWDVPTAADMSRYLSNIQRIKSYSGSTISLPSTMNNLLHTDANNIELVLAAGYEKLGVM